MLAHGLVLLAPDERHLIADRDVQQIGQTFAEDDGVHVIILQEAPGGDILCHQAERCFHRRLDAGDGDGVGAFPVADHAAGMDALGGQRHLRSGHCQLDDFVCVLQRQYRLPVGSDPVTKRVDLDIAAVQAHRVGEHGLVGTP